MGNEVCAEILVVSLGCPRLDGDSVDLQSKDRAVRQDVIVRVDSAIVIRAKSAHQVRARQRSERPGEDVKRDSCDDDLLAGNLREVLVTSNDDSYLRKRE